MPENPIQKKGIESGGDAREPKIKKEGIEFRRNVEELETILRDRIRERCMRNRNKTKRLNSGAMPENPK